MHDWMPRFRVLVVDDEEYVYVQAADELRELGDDVELRYAPSGEAAQELCESEFFHLAFVDLHLGDGSPSSRGVFQHLKIFSPSCRIFAITKRLSDYASELLKEIEPGFSFGGLVDKTRDSPGGGRKVLWYRPGVEPELRRWREQLIWVNGIESVVRTVGERASRMNQQLGAAELGPIRVRESHRALADEIQWLLMGMFGAIGSDSEDERSTLDLRSLRRGFSSSVVLEVVPRLRFTKVGQPVAGNRCVVKIGPRSEIRREALKYAEVVRFGLTLEHRVELLGYIEGDALAAVCYSSAGGDAERLQTLDDLIADPDGVAWQRVLRDIFSPQTSRWYSVVSARNPIRPYFAHELGVELANCHGRLEEWVGRLLRAGLVRRNGQQLWIADTLLMLPEKEAVAAGPLVSPTPTCLLHGDLHGGNVLVDDRCRAHFIDYRNAGVGPRLLDLAALQATARFVHVEGLRPPAGWPESFDAGLARDIAAFVGKERKVLPQNGPCGDGARAKDSIRSRERWVEVVAELDRARLENFHDSEPAEALWTNFAYCLSLFRFVQMEWYRKVRLLAWLSAMTQEINRRA